jgi:thiamine biosynthesis lipoprotein
VSTVSAGALLSCLRDLGFVEARTSPVAFEHAPAAGGLVEVRGFRAAMGTRVAISAVGRSAARGEAGIVAAFDELDRLAAIFSRHDPATALSVLNQDGRLADPPPELTLVTTHAVAMHALTGGAFDVTVKPVLDLLAGCPPGYPPAPADLAEAAALVGVPFLRLTRRAIRFERGGMGVTLDGIAKGYIADRMAATLDRAGVRRYLIDAGGDIRARNLNGHGRPWVVGVRDPADDAGMLDVIALEGGSVATSGGYERFYAGDRACHHIITPDSGCSPREVASASVVAPRGLAADALATAVMVLGPRRGLLLIDRLPGCAAMVLDARGVRHRSREWARLRVPLPEGSPP